MINNFQHPENVCHYTHAAIQRYIKNFKWELPHLYKEFHRAIERKQVKYACIYAYYIALKIERSPEYDECNRFERINELYIMLDRFIQAQDANTLFK